jgi:hypothetical protein
VCVDAKPDGRYGSGGGDKIGYARPGHDDRMMQLRNRQLLSTGRFAIVALVAAGAGGCAMDTDSVGLLTADPLKYELYDCAQIAASVAGASSREQELRALIEKAERGGGGGTVVAAMAYRNDYLRARGELRLLHDTARNKGCPEQPAKPAATPAGKPPAAKKDAAAPAAKKDAAAAR